MPLDRPPPQQELAYGPMILKVVFVPPELARQWLTLNDNNRTLRTRFVQQYVRDMKEQRFHRVPVAICFDQAGLLSNGQHRLWAVVESGIGQEFLVAWNVPRESIAAQDLGLKRTLSDVASLFDTDIDSRRGAVARTMVFGPSDLMPRGFEELLAAYQDHRTVIDQACAVVPSRVAGINSMTLAVAARAWYSQDPEKIARFLKILQNGITDGPHESAAIRLREFCRGSAAGSSSRAMRLQVYWKAEAALKHFLMGGEITKVYGVSEEQFPVPGETGWKKRIDFSRGRNAA